MSQYSISIYPTLCINYAHVTTLVSLCFLTCYSISNSEAIEIRGEIEEQGERQMPKKSVNHGDGEQSVLAVISGIYLKFLFLPKSVNQ